MERVIRAGRRMLAVFATLLAIGCGDPADDGLFVHVQPIPGDPQPVPIPGPDADRVRSTGGLDNTERPVSIIGLPGAANDSATLTIENVRTKASAKTRATSAGTFVLQIAARLGDPLTLAIVGSNEPLALEVLIDPSINASMRGPGPADGVTPITRAGPELTIRGEANANSEVLAINPASGATTIAPTDAQGRFTVALRANAGDELLVYQDAVTLTLPWILTAP